MSNFIHCSDSDYKVCTGVLTADGVPVHVESNLPYALGAQSKATTTNPKDLLGDKKVSLDAVSPFANIEESLGMMDGEMKYGFRNWRDKAVRARVYVNAAKRHLDMWLEGQERASDSKVHHLGHARACLGILLDAQAVGNLIDDRASTGDLFEKKMERASKWVEWRKQYHKTTELLKKFYEMSTMDLSDIEALHIVEADVKRSQEKEQSLAAELDIMDGK